MWRGFDVGMAGVLMESNLSGLDNRWLFFAGK